MRNFRRRDLIISAGAAAPTLVLARLGFAAGTGFPEKDITFIIPFGPGGGFDTYVRAIAPAMEKYLPNKITVVPTNVSGGGGVRGAIEVYRAKPDGYTIGIFNIPGLFAQQKQGDARFDLTKLTWLGSMGRDSYGIAVGQSSPIKSIADLQALSRTRAIKFTSTGPASTAYSATLIASHILGIKPQMITGYQGSNDYVVGAIRGDGDAAVTALPLLRRMEAGKAVRVLATFEEHSSFPGAQDATTLGQPELSQILLERLVAAPPRLPADVKGTLATALAKAMAEPQVVAWAKKADIELSPKTPDQAVAILHDQAKFFAKWKKYLAAK